MNCPNRKDYPIECVFDLSTDDIVIPLDWTPRQAEKIISTIQLLEEKIWSLYADPIIAIHLEDNFVDEYERQYAEDECQRERFEDDIPF